MLSSNLEAASFGDKTSFSAFAGMLLMKVVFTLVGDPARPILEESI
jgi:hypothetical protein